MKIKVIIRYYRKEYKLNVYTMHDGDHTFNILSEKILDSEEEAYSGDLPVWHWMDSFDKLIIEGKESPLPIEEIVPSTDDTIIYYLDGGIINKEEAELKNTQLYEEGKKKILEMKEKEIAAKYQVLTMARESTLRYKVVKFFKDLFHIR